MPLRSHDKDGSYGATTSSSPGIALPSVTVRTTKATAMIASGVDTEALLAPTSDQGAKLAPWWSFANQRTRSLLMGQLLSVLIAVTGACSTELAQAFSFAAPAMQNCPNYISLVALYSMIRAAKCGREYPAAAELRLSGRQGERVEISDGGGGNGGGGGGDDAPIGDEKSVARSSEQAAGQTPWWRFFLLACIDVEANVLLVWAYQYTSITSVMLLDCFTIPSVMILSCVFLKARYTR